MTKKQRTERVLPYARRKDKPSMLAMHMSAVLIEAGRINASGMIRKGEPMISFAEWVQRHLDKVRR